MPSDHIPDISVVIPVYNEAENLIPLVHAVRDALTPEQMSFEVLLVDDGSTDGSAEILKDLARKFPEVRAVILRRNFGQSAAMTAGFDHARGRILISMDGDLQNDPKDIPRIVSRLNEGYDLVSGWRRDRKDPFLSRRLPSILANRIIGMATGVRLHDYGCSLKAYRREVTDNLLLYGELHRFIPVLADLYGVKIAEMEVTHHPRTKGRSKYGIGRTYRVLLDLLLMLFFRRFATRPLQFFGLSGGALFLGGFAIESYLAWVKLWLGEDIGSRPLLLLGALLIITGIMLFGTGLIAELVIRTYYEATGKRIYSVREILE
ncbi:MAG: glycosyltransferase family 2 protein [Deltaproteobacteria bacterium]